MPNEKKSEGKKSEENTGKEKIPSKSKHKRTKKVIALVAVAALAIIGIALLYNYYNQPSSIEFHYASAFGLTWAFRANLRDAEKVKVEPSEDAVYYELFSLGDGPFVQNVTIAFKDAGPEDNKYYQLQVLELVSKLNTIYKMRYPNGEPPGFDAIPVDSYYKLPGKMQNPIIAIVHPKFASDTSIKMENHVITLDAKTVEDMDLVTAKLLMIALQLKRV